jgi:hypothetical protein
MPEIDFDSLDLPGTGTLPVAATGAATRSSGRTKQQARQATPRRTRTSPTPQA